MPSSELNSFKLFFFSNLIIVMGLLILLMLTPTSGVEVFAIGALSLKMSLGLAYFLFFVSCLGIIALDLALREAEMPLDTITVEQSPRFWVQRLFGFEAGIIASVVAGLFLAFYYYSGISVQHKMFIFVPNFFQVSPFAASIGLTAKVYDIVMSSIAVSYVEEMLFVGIFFCFIWKILEFTATRVMRLNFDSLLVNVGTMLIAAVLMGLTASLMFHSFAPNYNAYSFQDCANYFTMSSFIAGSTGSIYGGVIAHAIHNYAAKTFTTSGSYQVIGEYFPS